MEFGNDCLNKIGLSASFNKAERKHKEKPSEQGELTLKEELFYD